MQIGVLGGTGPAGRGIAARLAAAGHDVVVGSRDRERGRAASSTSSGSSWGDRVAGLEPGTNHDAADADLVVLATVWDAAVAHRAGPRRPARGQDRDLDGERAREARAASSSPVPSPAGLDRGRGPGRRARGARRRRASTTSLRRRSATSTSQLTERRARRRRRRRARTIVLDLIDGIPGPAGLRRRHRCENALGIEAFSAAPAHRQPPAQGRGDAAHRRVGPRGHDQRRHDASSSSTPRSARVVPFEVGPVVRMYVCGITPYDSTHLGHAATYLTYDLLIRRLEELGHEVRMVRNVTDVDDSILPKARELGVPYLELAEAELARFRSDMDALGMRPPLAEPRATESIDGMIEMVDEAPRRRPRVRSARHRLLRRRRRSRATASCRTTRATRWCAWRASAAATPTIPHRRDPLDFVLWQPSLPDEPSWARAVRRRPPRLARRVLGDVDARARTPPSTSTAAAPTSSSRTTSARSRRARASPASRSRATGCTRRW